METKPRNWSWLLLITTSATLICCAIPILLVTLGMGAAVASMASAAPWLIGLSANKPWVFAISGALIGVAMWSVYRPGRTCPTDPELAAACAVADKWNKRFLNVSATLWIVGFVAAFLLEYMVDS
jgi:mercuric ion transport protein